MSIKNKGFFGRLMLINKWIQTLHQGNLIFLCKKLQNMEKFFIVLLFLLLLLCLVCLLYSSSKYQKQNIILFYSCVWLWTRIAIEHYVVGSCQNNEKFFLFLSLFFSEQDKWWIGDWVHPLHFNHILSFNIKCTEFYCHPN